MEPYSSKRIKIESKTSCSQKQLVESNLMDNVTSLDSSRNLNDSLDPDLVFEALRWTPFFVDKSMLIRSIIKDKTRRILLTAPPRFGKTMAKNLLEMFFEIANDEQKLEKYKCFKDLKIYKCSEECSDNHDCPSQRLFHKHCGQHPVISLDFAQLSETSYSAFLEGFRSMISRQFQKYGYLIHKDAEKYKWSSNNMEDLDVDDFLQYLKAPFKDNYWNAATGQKEGYILRAFEYLIKVLSVYYQTKKTHKKIIILIDEFDAPFMELLFSEHSDEKIITFIRDLMRLLCKDEVSAEFVERVVIFSVTALGGMISLGANNVVEQRTFLDKDYDYYKYFGFTKKEVEDLVRNTVTESQRQEAVLDEIAVWYNSYIVAGDNDTTICNPVSIVKYLRRLVRKSYWVDSVGAKYVCQLFQFEKLREKLFHAIRDDQNISIDTTTVQLDDISNLKSLSEAIFNCNHNNQVDLALQFFTECGYFNVVEKKSMNWKLQIPNQELKQTFTNNLYRALLSAKTNHQFDVKQQESFVNALESLGCGEEHEPMKYVVFKQSVENLYSNRELPKAHFHFHCDLLMLIFGSEKFHRFSELPIKKGWSPTLDLIIATKSAAIIIEVKRDKQDSAKKALKQCLQKEYYKAFELEENKRKVLNKILMGLHLSDDGKVSIRYLENFDWKTLPDNQNRKTLIKAIVEGSYEC